MGTRKIVNAGDVYGRLTVVSETAPQQYVKNTGQPYCKRVFLMKCSCGNTELIATQLNHLVTGKTLSCGCYRKEIIDKRGLEFRTTHGMSETPTYITYKAMKARCSNSSFIDWDRYGGDGVTICERWLHSFENFIEDMGERPAGCSLNRIKGSKLYSKDTCEWATLSVQSYDTKIKSTNTSGRTGVGFYNGKWTASIGFQNERRHLGRFITKEEAIKARELAEMELYGFTKK
jgi:hypothetical protein